MQTVAGLSVQRCREKSVRSSVEQDWARVGRVFAFVCCFNPYVLGELGEPGGDSATSSSSAMGTTLLGLCLAPEMLTCTPEVCPSSWELAEISLSSRLAKREKPTRRSVTMRRTQEMEKFQVKLIPEHDPESLPPQYLFGGGEEVGI